MGLFLGMVVGCGGARPHPGPPVISAIPPPTMKTAPDPIEKRITPQKALTIRRIHEHLFKESQDHFEGGEFPQAISSLTRLLALNPEGPIERDGQWLLAQSYHQIGEWESSVDLYRTLASAPKGNQYQREAMLKFKEIQGLLEQSNLPPQDTQAIRLTLEQLPNTSGFDHGIQKMKQDGVTTLLIDLGCKGAAVQTDRPQRGGSPQDLPSLHALLHSYASRSHRQHVLMYVGVNLRCVGNWHILRGSEWHDRSYNVATHVVEANMFFDVFHPDYQEFLEGFLAQLSEDGVDGIVFLDDHPLGVVDGVSLKGLQRFEKGLGVAFQPSRVFRQDFDPLQASKHSQKSTSTETRSHEDAVFWRWAGWKARERLNILEELMGNLRKRYPTVLFGLELHPHGFTDPVRALVDYGEDAMEAARRPFSFFFVRPELDRKSAFDQQAVIDKLRRISTKAVLTRLLPVVDNPRRVWVSMPAKGGKRIVPQTATGGASLLQDFPSGIGVVHDLRSFS